MNVRDIIQTKSEYGSRQFVIIEILTKNQFRCISQDNKKRYVLSLDQIQSKIGEVGINDPILLSEELDIEAGFEYALRQSKSQSEDAKKWLFLADCGPGKVIYLIHRKAIFPVEFIGINPKRPRYPIRGKMRGKAADFSLTALNLDLQH